MKLRTASAAGLALAASVLLASAARGQAGETYTATASVKSDAITGTAPVRIQIDRFATDEDRKKVMGAMKKGGTHAVQAVLKKMKDSGTLEAGERKVAIKYAYAHPAGSGRVLTVAAAQPLHHLGSGLPDAKSKKGYDLAVAVLVLEADGTGHGEFSPAAKVKMTEADAVVIDDYGSAKIWLKGVAKAK